ncbi:MAG: glycosyltransferase family 2 protein [Thermoanaerobaculia bacterium]|nr:glycosyltransferase family 2 protein [Thermoanaerobaculia bacterium]
MPAAGHSKLLSVVIPVFNEVDTVETVVERVRAAPVEMEVEIVLVDDGSTDGSRDRLARLAERHDTRAFFHQVNRGKGAALRTGFAEVRGDLVLVQDADLEYHPRDYPLLLAPILDDRADVVYGSRFVSGEHRRVLYFWHYVANRAITLLSNAFTNLNLSDMETCYKVFRREVVERLEIRENRFGFEPEVTARIAAMGCRVYEVGISYAGRTYEEGKKIGWRDGLWALWCIPRYNLALRLRPGTSTRLDRDASSTG